MSGLLETINDMVAVEMRNMGLPFEALGDELVHATRLSLATSVAGLVLADELFVDPRYKKSTFRVSIDGDGSTVSCTREEFLLWVTEYYQGYEDQDLKAKRRTVRAKLGINE